MPENGRKNILRHKKTTRKVPLTFLEFKVLTERFQRKKKGTIDLGRPNDNIKSKCYALTGYKQRNKVCLVYLECTVQLGRWIFKLERRYLDTSKQQTRYC